MIRSISINGGEFYRVGKYEYTFSEENEELLKPVEKTFTFDELFEYGESDWFYTDYTAFRKKKYMEIEDKQYSSVFNKYTEKTLQSITVRNTHEIYQPSLGDLMQWKPIDKVIEYLKDRGLVIK